MSATLADCVRALRAGPSRAARPEPGDLCCWAAPVGSRLGVLVHYQAERAVVRTGSADEPVELPAAGLALATGRLLASASLPLLALHSELLGQHGRLPSQEAVLRYAALCGARPSWAWAAFQARWGPEQCRMRRADRMLKVPAPFRVPGWVPERDSAGYHLVPVFVSSTFLDMHGERDYLTRHCEPMINQRLARYRVRVRFIDLRWGLVEGGNPLMASLAGVHCCRPWCVLLSSERYGYDMGTSAGASYPVDYDCCTADFPRSEVDWVEQAPPGLSVTAMEVRHALQRPGPTHFFMYVRDLEQQPSEGSWVFSSDSAAKRAGLAAMRESVLAHEFSLVRPYKCRVDQLIRRGGEVVGGVVAGLEELGASVVQDLTERIQHELAGRATPDLELQSPSEVSVLLRGHSLEGRAQLMATAACATKPVLLLVAESGLGKSSLMAQLCGQLRGSGRAVVSYFVGAQGPASSSLYDLLKGLCCQIEQLSGGQSSPVSEPSAADVLQRLNGALARAVEAKGQVDIMVDALDQCSHEHGAHTLHWLPSPPPPGVRLVLTCTPGTVADTARTRFEGHSQELTLDTLTVDERVSAAQRFMAGYRKELDPVQLETLVSKTDAGVPLYLKAAGTEVVLFGLFEGLLDFIAALPGTISALYDATLERIERESGQARMVRSAAVLLYCSQAGLAADELSDLLSQDADVGEASSVFWPPIHRLLEAIVIPRLQMPPGARLCFQHVQIRQAVQRRYLASENDERVVHLRLAEYFRSKLFKKDPPAKASNQGRNALGLLYHLQHAQEWERLGEAVAEFEVLFQTYENESFPERRQILLEAYKQAVDNGAMPAVHAVTSAHGLLANLDISDIEASSDIFSRCLRTSDLLQTVGDIESAGKITMAMADPFFDLTSSLNFDQPEFSARPREDRVYIVKFVLATANNIGNFMFRCKKVDWALYMYELVARIATSHSKDLDCDPAEAAARLYNMANCYLAKGNFELALMTFEKAKNIMHSTGSHSHHYVDILICISTCLDAMGRLDASVDLLFQAKIACIQTVGERSLKHGFVLMGLGARYAKTVQQLVEQGLESGAKVDEESVQAAVQRGIDSLESARAIFMALLGEGELQTNYCNQVDYLRAVLLGQK